MCALTSLRVFIDLLYLHEFLRFIVDIVMTAKQTMIQKQLAKYLENT